MSFHTDSTPQLFAPARRGGSAFSRLRDADAVINRNTDAAQRSGARYVDITRLLLGYRLALRSAGGGGDDPEEPCVNQ